MSRRLTPLKDAIQYVSTKRDKTSKLEVKYINEEKGKFKQFLLIYNKS